MNGMDTPSQPDSSKEKSFEAKDSHIGDSFGNPLSSLGDKDKSVGAANRHGECFNRGLLRNKTNICNNIFAKS